MSHTRWATHGAPSVENAHPHGSGNDEFVVVHNGIISNCDALKKYLMKKGYIFKSETDTECIPLLIFHLWKTRAEEDLSFVDLIQKTLQQLDGTFAMAVKVIINDKINWSFSVRKKIKQRHLKI
jgi:glucosamine--fructose-6-phosphate aminotransferase (isomerizing)